MMKKYNILFMEKKNEERRENVLNNILACIMANPAVSKILLGSITFNSRQRKWHKQRKSLEQTDVINPHHEMMNATTGSVIMAVASVFFIVISIALIKDMVKNHKIDPDASNEERDKFKSRVIVTIVFPLFTIGLTALTVFMFMGVI